VQEAASDEVNWTENVRCGRHHLNWEVILLESDTLGAPDTKLGAILISNYLRLLSERENLPEFIILLNGGVRLATKASEALEYLKRLEERGVAIISCLTCAEYFGIESDIAVGKIEGMKSIQDILEAHTVLTV
jgi:selenium metabolism protein YedF